MSGTVDFLTKKEDTYSASLARGLRFETVDYLKADKLAAQLTKKTQRLHFARVVNEVELDEAKQLKFQI